MKTENRLRSYIERRLLSLEGCSESCILWFTVAVEKRYRTQPDPAVLSAWWRMLREARAGAGAHSRRNA